jgi:6-pyruvoyltetrahydropterin/6-carboxytetrahydropterin synthase
MAYTIAKKFRFCASHLIDGLPEGHKCGRLHGHNYTVEVVLSSPTLNPVGFVRDYGELAAFQEILDKQCDHHHLNDVLGHNIAKLTTAELLARYFFSVCKTAWPETVEVRVSETENTWASYRED